MIYNIALLQKAFRLNERLSATYNSPHILYWGFDIEANTERWQRRPQLTKSFIISNFTVALGSGTCIYLLLANRLFSDFPIKIPFVHLFIFFLIAIFGSMCIGINTLLIMSGDQFPKEFIKLHQYSNFAMLRIPTPHNTFLQRFKSNLPGLISILTVSLCGIITTLFFPIAIYLKIDPFIWLPCYTNLYLPLRLVICFVYLRESFRTAALSCLIFSFHVPLVFNCLHYCDSFTVGFGGINAYQLLRRIMNINVNYCANFTGMLLASFYVILVSATAVIICGYRLLPGPILVMLITGVLTIYIVMGTYLPWVSLINDWSNGIIQKWRRVLGNMDKNRRFVLRRYISALRPIAFRCGRVGYLTRNTKGRYFRSIFEGFFDVVIAFQEGMQY
ncbi:unnamed protein product [Orchesella dallaii]|uniref:Odorant receptor n=1 Tax=Orchesella dallaii TaxID=48710 RepID=A0ABP1RJQ1_9HEXA